MEFICQYGELCSASDSEDVASERESEAWCAPGGSLEAAGGGDEMPKEMRLSPINGRTSDQKDSACADQDVLSESSNKNDELHLNKRQLKHQQYVDRRKNTHAVIFDECLCDFECTTQISMSRRYEINEAYWRLSLDKKRSFIVKHSFRADVKRRRVEPNICDSSFKRSCTYIYKLNDNNNNDRPVCSRFFLNTLGYKSSSKAHESTDKELCDHNSKNATVSPLMQTVQQDILSYNPTISHYRREHAPNVRYLPSDITCRKMYDEFKLRRKSKSLDGCSYSYYNRILTEMNIHFTKLGHELCEKCRVADIHMKSTGHRKMNHEEKEFRNAGFAENDESDGKEDDPEFDEVASSLKSSSVVTGETTTEEENNCSQCAEWLEHRDAVVSSRQEYEKDKLANEGLSVSVDLQKVIQLPRMERFKEVIFAKRIVAMNETFAPLGGGKNGAVHAVLWNETISGRKASDLCSVFTKHLLLNGLSKRILYWLDNCSSQNKNWNLFIHLILLVNSSLVKTETITFKYLESGHTFMSADAFHAAVERSMKQHKEGELHTFSDFVNCVEQANVVEEPVVTVMNYNDFFEPSVQMKPSVLNKIKPRPKISEIKQIRFTRGSFGFQYKTSFDGDFKEVQLFTKAQLKEVQNPTFTLSSTLKFNTEDRGIEKSRKDYIVKKICPLMPANDRVYWENLVVNDISDEF